MTFASKAFSAFNRLKAFTGLPAGIEVMNPYKETEVKRVLKLFLNNYYNDFSARTLVLGINPGRFGGGITGIAFTDPIKLETECGIKNSFEKKPELSAGYIYKMIDAYGGATKFYSRFFISSVCPLGFTLKGKNMNYYDDKNLEKAVAHHSIEWIKTMLSFPSNKEVCFCLGEGENYKYLLKLNEQHKFFGKVISLPHPRFIMQYKRKRVDEYLGIYLEKLRG